MASNLQLSELETIMLDTIKDSDGLTERQIVDGFSECFGHHVRGSLCDISEIHQMIAQLVSLNFISQDEDLRYVAVGGAL